MAEQVLPTAVGRAGRHVTAGRVVLAGVAGVGLLAAGGVVVALRSWRATEQVVQAVVAPDAAHIARVISVSGPGASGKHYLVVRIGRMGPQGPVGDDSGAFWLENAHEVSVQWVGPRRLVVEYPASGVVDGKTTRVGPVRVAYVPVDPLRPTQDRGRGGMEGGRGPSVDSASSARPRGGPAAGVVR
jgi:hypothetical protein